MPGIEVRVVTLENEMREVRAILGRMEPLLVRLDERTANLATKAELAEVRADLKAELAEVRSDLKAELAQVRSDVKAELAEVRSDVKAELAEVRADLKAELGEVRSDILVELAGKATKGTVWTVGLTLAGVIVAAMAAGAVYMPYVAALLRRAGP